MLPTDILKDEHKVVLFALDGAEKEAEAIRATGKVNHEKIEKIIDFSRNFTDGCHHAKEEKLLFPKLEERGFDRNSGPVGVMMMEHVEGRRLIAKIAESSEIVRKGDENGKHILTESLLRYVGLLRNHISKENNILFEIAENMLTAEDKQELLQRFEDLENNDTGEVEHERYQKLAHEINDN